MSNRLKLGRNPLENRRRSVVGSLIEPAVEIPRPKPSLCELATKPKNLVDRFVEMKIRPDWEEIRGALVQGLGSISTLVRTVKRTRSR